nr:hypothetical protein [Priestia megaterium]
MLAMLFASEIIEGNWTYARVPSIWKEDVRVLLNAEGREDLINA